ncbi:MAG: MarR family transcriptional regulator [Rhizobiaceae bacterium]|nr:MarR family transcriptional regulator [Rhizobiaceae bacterium]
MKFDKDRSAGFLANHMARLFAKGLQHNIKPLGLAPAQFMTLLALWEKDGLTQRELVDRLNVEQATMANTLTRMERDGLVKRRAHPQDGRSQSIHLTQKALSLRQAAMGAAQSVNEIALGELNDEEREVFLGLAHRVINALKQRY